MLTYDGKNIPIIANIILKYSTILNNAKQLCIQYFIDKKILKHMDHIITMIVI